MDELREGYKKTKLGYIPIDWDIKLLGELCNKITDGTHKTPQYVLDGVKFISAKNIVNGKIDWSDTKYITNEEHETLVKRCNPEDGDILLAKSGTLGIPAIVKKSFEFSLFESLALIKYKRDKINGEYLYQYLSGPIMSKIYHLETKGLSIKHLHLTEINKFKIIVPEKCEQEKISKILSTWDDTIDKMEALIEEKKIIKKGLMQQLLTGNKILKEFKEQEWKKIKLKKILKKRNKISEVTSELPLYSLTIEEGVTPKTDRYNREFLVKQSDKKYKVVEYNDIVYNPANLRFGAIALNKNINNVLVSPIYEILFISDNEKYDVNFISQILTSPRQITIFSTKAEGTLVERMAVKIDTFLNTDIKVPATLAEQSAIANILTTADKEISLLEEKLEILIEQKKGLMQDLLIGKIRVKV